MRQVIERVTCDKCGQVFDFEKVCNSPMRGRIESLTDWLLKLGWRVVTTRSTITPHDLCPNCTDERI